MAELIKTEPSEAEVTAAKELHRKYTEITNQLEGVIVGLKDVIDQLLFVSSVWERKFLYALHSSLARRYNCISFVTDFLKSFHYLFSQSVISYSLVSSNDGSAENP